MIGHRFGASTDSYKGVVIAQIRTSNIYTQKISLDCISVLLAAPLLFGYFEVHLGPGPVSTSGGSLEDIWTPSREDPLNPASA